MVQMNKTTSVGTPSAAACAGAKVPDAGDLMAVVARYQSPLLRYVGQMLGRVDHEAEDIVQEAFIRLHSQVAGHGPGSVRHLTTWLFRVTHNLTLDTLRQRQRRSRVAQSGAESGSLAEEQVADELDALGEVIRMEAREVALRELAQMDGDLRQVLLLKITQEMTLREVAEVVGVSLSTVNYRLNRGMTELARRLRRAGVV